MQQDLCMSSDSSIDDDTDSDPDYLPEQSSLPEEHRRFGSIWSRPSPDDELNKESKKEEHRRLGSIRSRPSTDDELNKESQKEEHIRLGSIRSRPSPDDELNKESKKVLVCLETRLKEYERQWAIACDSGSKSSLRRKAKRVKQYKQCIIDAKDGVPINISSLPNPYFSPAKKHTNVSSTPATSFPLEINEEESKIINSRETNNGQNSDKKYLLKTTTRKENYCMECKKMVKEFCKHYENVHKNTEEGKKLQALNKIEDKVLKKKLKTNITDLLRKKGNAEFSSMHAKSLFAEENNIVSVIPVKRSSESFNQNNSVQCSHCEGFYKRRKFSQHLHRCKQFLISTLTTNSDGNSDKMYGNIDGSIPAVKDHALPVIKAAEGASEQLMNEVIKIMKPRPTKDVALNDKLIMQYASEFHKTRREGFQKVYVARVITDLSRVVMRMQEVQQQITCLEDIFNPAYFSVLVKCILEEAGYNENMGTVQVCGLGNRLRSHIKAAAETAKKEASAKEYTQWIAKDVSGYEQTKNKRKMLKHFLKLMEEKWANEAGRIFDAAVKQSRSESQPKLAAEEDIVKTCQYVTSNYRKLIQELDQSTAGSVIKQKAYNTLLDLLITHMMCLIRRRPVDFKRAQNLHYEKMEMQEDLLSEIKNSKHMSLSDEDLRICNKFNIFYVPGKGWKELVPIALTDIMKLAMDTIQRNKRHVGIKSNMLFVRAKEMPVNPRESLRKITKNLKLKKPMDLSGNGLRHHAGTFSKLHSAHPNYQDYLASALGHTLHIHKLHYEMPTSIVQKLIVCPVLDNMTKPVAEREESNPLPIQEVTVDIHHTIDNDNQEDYHTQGDCKSDEIDKQPYDDLQHNIQHEDNKKTDNCAFSGSGQNDVTRHEEDGGLKTSWQCATPEKGHFELEKDGSFEESDSRSEDEKLNKAVVRKKWSDREKCMMYRKFGRNILEYSLPQRSTVSTFLNDNKDIFGSRSIASLMSFLQSKCKRKAKNVTPEVKKFLSRPLPKTHRKITNVPL